MLVPFFVRVFSAAPLLLDSEMMEHGLGRRWRALQPGRETDVPHLEVSALGFDPHITGHTRCQIGALVHNREKQRILPTANVVHPRAIFRQRPERTVRHVSPHSPLAIQRIGRVQGFGMKLRIERLHAAKPPRHRLPRRDVCRFPIRHRKTIGLAEAVTVLVHVPNSKRAQKPSTSQTKWITWYC